MQDEHTGVPAVGVEHAVQLVDHGLVERVALVGSVEADEHRRVAPLDPQVAEVGVAHASSQSKKPRPDFRPSSPRATLSRSS